MGTGEGSGIPRHLQEQNPSSQCLQMWRTQKFLSPTVPDFSSRFPFRGMMGRSVAIGDWAQSLEQVLNIPAH